MLKELRLKHPIYRVVSFKILKPFTLLVRFDDGIEREINFEPVLGGDMYRPLREPDLFNQVKIDLEVHTMVWPNGADFDPDTLYNWPSLEKALVDRVRAWERVAV